MTHPFGDLASPLDRATRLNVMATKPVRHAMQARPFGRERALWMCRGAGCGAWNARESQACRSCRGVRAE